MEEFFLFGPWRSLVGWKTCPVGDEAFGLIWMELTPTEPPWRCWVMGLRPERLVEPVWCRSRSEFEPLGMCWLEAQGTVLQLPHQPLPPEVIRLFGSERLWARIERVRPRGDAERMWFQTERVDPATGRVLALVEAHRVVETYC